MIYEYAICVKCGDLLQIKNPNLNTINDYICKKCFIDKFGLDVPYNPIFNYKLINQVLNNGFFDKQNELKQFKKQNEILKRLSK